MNKIRKTGSRFVAVGLVSTAFNYGLFYSLLKGMDVNYLAASIIGYLAGLSLGFVLNNFWTFEFGRWQTSKALGYLIVYLLSLCLSTSALYIMVSFFHMNAAISNVLSICLSMTTNFVGLNFIIYQK